MLCMQAFKALVSLHRRAGLSEPSLLKYMIRTKILGAGLINNYSHDIKLLFEMKENWSPGMSKVALKL